MDEKQVGQWLGESKQSLSGYAVRNYNQDAFIKSAMLAIVESASLKECLTTPAGKASLFNAMRHAATTGLSLNPSEGKAALIAYGGKVQYQVMKNGIIELAMQSGQVEFVTADTVRENDLFTVTKTADGDNFNYQPKRKDRGEIDGFFAACKLKNGSTHVKWMTIKEIEEHRDKYSSMYNAKPDASPWKKSFEGMGLKTVIKALFRNLSICPELDAAVISDDQEETQIINVTPKGTSAEDVATILESKPAPAEKKAKQETTTQGGLDF